MDLTVVIRGAGERTANQCYELVCDEVASCHVFQIREQPFTHAVRRTFEIGIAERRKWTAAIDADVLVRSGAFEDLIDLAERSPEELFELEGRIWDKLFCGPRPGGIHLFRTTLIPKAIDDLDWEEPTHRPESRVIQRMVSLGHPQNKHEVIVGIHDFFQYERDLYRKGFVHAQKHASQVETFFQPMWQRLAKIDPDFQTVLHGMNDGRAVSGYAITDVTYFQDQLEAKLRGLGIREKQELIQKIDPDAILRELHPAKEFEAWEKSLTHASSFSRRLKQAIEIRLQRWFSRGSS